jgi:hypothetical protein
MQAMVSIERHQIEIYTSGLLKPSLAPQMGTPATQFDLESYVYTIPHPLAHQSLSSKGPTGLGPPRPCCKSLVATRTFGQAGSRLGTHLHQPTEAEADIMETELLAVICSGPHGCNAVEITSSTLMSLGPF